MENRAKEHPEIKGWGVDANPENDPTYPMKERTDAEQTGLSWDRPPQQPPTVEVLKSIERPNLSAVIGTATPPSGLSGKIRRYAFQFSESSWGHWLPLILADRVNEVEGIVDDLKRGHIPNFFAEKGWSAQWKYNRKAVVQKVLVTAVITSAVILFFNRKKKDDWDS